jgi:uncharacterized protein
VATSNELRELRRAAADHTFFAPVALREAIDTLGFIQADPIRAPARAQDLILRQRVTGYRAGDLERAYPTLPLVEDMVHVYGFVHRKHRNLLHPRRIARTFRVEEEHPHLRRAILAYLLEHGPSHPRDIEQAMAARYSRASMVNAWGGQSNATTHMLDILHYRGLLQVVRRERGIRVYGLPMSSNDDDVRLTPQKRAEGLIELLVRLYAPLPKASLMQLTLMLGERAIAREAVRARIPSLLRRGAIRSTRVDGIEYFWPAHNPDAKAIERSSEPSVRFLAPFDPLVWDRRRFELLWGWAYRFEAYTPLAKRRLGYYALPLLWDHDEDPRVIGWVNVTRSDGKRIAAASGYDRKRPAGAAFKAAFDAEVARLESFLARDIPSDEVIA